MTTHRTDDHHTLRAAADQLTQPRRLRLNRDNTDHTQIVTIPSLIQQLEQAIARAGNGTGSGATTSRPPIAVGVVALLIEIARGASEGANTHAGQHTNTIQHNLRKVVAALADRPEGDPDITYWTWQINRWIGQAQAALGAEPKYPIGLRETPCPDCGAKDAPGVNDEGNPIRIPALQFVWSDRGDNPILDYRTVRAVQCAMCAALWWSGAQFHQLSQRINTQPGQAAS